MLFTGNFDAVAAARGIRYDFLSNADSNFARDMVLNIHFSLQQKLGGN